MSLEEYGTRDDPKHNAEALHHKWNKKNMTAIIKNNTVQQKIEAQKMQKKERYKNRLNTKLLSEGEDVKRRFMINHPVLRLLERNAKQINANDIFMKEQERNSMKAFKGSLLGRKSGMLGYLLEEARIPNHQD